MLPFDYRNDELFADDIPVKKIAEQYGTPLYIYLKKNIENQWRKFSNALKINDHLICYAVKANSNLAILQLLVKLGSGFDIVSQGELIKVLKANADPSKIVFSGVGKSALEIQRALLAGIQCFNVESLPELKRINEIACKLKKVAPISLRINPDVNAKTHPYIATGLKKNKFGIGHDVAEEAYKIAMSLPYLNIIGIGFHIGSQITELDPFLQAMDRILIIVDKLNKLGVTLSQIDIGGGLGVRYRNETPPTIAHFVAEIIKKLANYPGLKIIIEPGRAIVADAGLLVTKVEYLKQHENQSFAIVDAGLNDMLRPALYNAWMDIIPVTVSHSQAESTCYHVVGPVCETSDYLGKDRFLNLSQGDLIAICKSGAYGFSMSSHYNSRPRPAEVLVDGAKSYLVRQRESSSDLWRGEQLIESEDEVNVMIKT